MIKTDERKIKEVLEKLNTNSLTDDEFTFVKWLCGMNDEKFHNVFIGLLDKVK